MAETSLATPPTSSARLIDLAEELISDIASRVDSDDLFAFRLTCRNIEAKAFSYFTKRHFRRKCFMFSTASLKVLRQISEHERLRAHVHQIYINATVFPGHANKGSGLSRYGYNASKDVIHGHAALKEYHIDQQHLKQTGDQPGGDRHYLIEAFKSLPSLTRITLIDEPEGVPGGGIDCYGWNTVARKIRVYPGIGSFQIGEEEVYCSWISHFWKTILYAVADSGISTIQHLETALTYRRYKWVFWRDFDCSPTLLRKLQKCFANLQSVKLQVRSSAVSKEIPHLELSDTTSQAIKNMAKYSSVFKNAKTFHFTGDYEKRTGKLLMGLMSKFDFKTLTRLVIESCSIDHRSLAAIVCLAEVAETIALHAINLDRGTWNPILQALLKLPKLNHLHLWFLREDRTPVSFFKIPNKPLKGPKHNSMHSALQSYNSMHGYSDPAEMLREVYGIEPYNAQAQADQAKKAAKYLYKNQDPTSEEASDGGPGQGGKPLVYTPKRPKCDHKYPLLPPLSRSSIVDGNRGSKLCLMGNEIALELPSFIEVYNKNKSADPNGGSTSTPNVPSSQASTAMPNHSQSPQQGSNTASEESPDHSGNASDADADSASHDAAVNGGFQTTPGFQFTPPSEGLEPAYGVGAFASDVGMITSFITSIQDELAPPALVHPVHGGQVDPVLVSIDVLPAGASPFPGLDLIAAQNSSQPFPMPNTLTSAPSTTPSQATPMPPFGGFGPALGFPSFYPPWVPPIPPPASQAVPTSQSYPSLDFTLDQTSAAVTNNTNEPANEQPAVGPSQPTPSGDPTSQSEKGEAEKANTPPSDQTEDDSAAKIAAEFKDVGGLLGPADLLNEHDAADFESDCGAEDFLNEKK